MSRSTANWIFFFPLVLVGLLLVQPSISGGSEVIDEPVDIFGLLLAVLGLAVRVISRDWKITHSNGKLVTSGPYSLVRHPMYIGSFFAGLGLCIIIGDVQFIAAFSIVYTLAHMLVVRREEKLIAAIWPDEFSNYRRAVPAIFPRLSRITKASFHNKPAVSSLRKAVKRELSPICGVVSGGLLLEAREDYAVIGWPREHTEITIYVTVALVLITIWAFNLFCKKSKAVGE